LAVVITTAAVFSNAVWCESARGQAIEKTDKSEKPEKAAAPTGEPLNQSYQELTPDPPTLRGWQHAMGRESLYQSVNQMVLGNTPVDNNEFDKFFAKQVFPQFTLYKVAADVNVKGQTNVIVIDPESDKDELFQKSRLPSMRDVFLKRFLAPVKDEAMFTHLSDLTVSRLNRRRQRRSNDAHSPQCKSGRSSGRAASENHRKARKDCDRQDCGEGRVSRGARFHPP
jgi:hypothetical protein